MIEVRYVSSNGREYNLITDHIRPTSGTFHSYEWKANEAEIENGTEVYAWTKDPITYQITVTVRGSISERKRILNELTSAFEYDIANISPGRLYFDEYYIECFAKVERIRYLIQQLQDRILRLICIVHMPFGSKRKQRAFLKMNRKIASMNIWHIHTAIVMTTRSRGKVRRTGILTITEIPILRWSFMDHVQIHGS